MVNWNFTPARGITAIDQPPGWFFLGENNFRKLLTQAANDVIIISGGDEMQEKTISFKVDEEFFREIKIQIAKEGKTLKDYIVELIRRDLEAKSK
jgi:hypothetical protein